jgi:hypothetical protein
MIIIQFIMFRLFIYLTKCLISLAVTSGPLSPGHVASSGCGWRRLPEIRRVAANILSKHSQTADKRWSPQLRNWARCQQLPTVKTYDVNEKFHWASDLH